MIFTPLNQYGYAFPAVPPVIVGSCMIVLAISILIREKASRVSLAFSGVIVSAAFWLLSFGGIYNARDVATAIFWAKIENLGVAFIPCALFYFTLNITRRWETLHQPARVCLGA